MSQRSGQGKDKEQGKDRTFTVKKSLDRHLISHQEWTPGYKCPDADCGYSVIALGVADMTTHLRKKHRDTDWATTWEPLAMVMVTPASKARRGPSPAASEVGSVGDDAGARPRRTTQMPSSCQETQKGRRPPAPRPTWLQHCSLGEHPSLWESCCCHRLSP